MCLAQRHKTVTPARLKPASSRSRVKQSTTEPLRFLDCVAPFVGFMLRFYFLQNSVGQKAEVNVTRVFALGD